MLGVSALSEVPLSELPGPIGRGLFSFRARFFLQFGQGKAAFGFKASGNWDFRIFTADHEFAALSRSGDPDATRAYRGGLTKAVSFQRSIMTSDGFDGMTAGWGEMEVDNTEGDYDYLVRGYAIDGRSIKVRLGDLDGFYEDQFTLFDGTAKGWQINESRLLIALRDNGYRLEVPAQPNTYAGTGGTQGTADLKGKRRPRALGWCGNVEPPLVIPNLLAFQANDGPVDDIPAVYSRGASVTRGPDYSTLAGLLAAIVEAGTYATCLAAGWFRVNFVLDGEVTADVRGDKTGGVYAGTAAAIVRRLAVGAAKIVDPSGLYLPAFASVEARQPAEIGIWLGTDDEDTVAEIAARIMASVGGWVGFRRNGKLEVGIFATPSGVPTARFGPVEIREITRERLPDALNPPPYRYRMAWGRNWTTQTNLAGTVSEARRAYLAEGFRLAEAVSMQVRVDHPLASDPAPVESFFRYAADAQAEAERRLFVFGRTNSLYRITVRDAPFSLDVGNLVRVTYRRWDLTTGRLLRLVSVTEDSESDDVEIVGFG